MGGCCSGFGWVAWGGLGTIGLILNLVLFVGLLVMLGIGSVWLVRQVRHRSSAPADRPAPLGIAQQRLAAGDITVEEFEEIRDRLRS